MKKCILKLFLHNLLIDLPTGILLVLSIFLLFFDLGIIFLILSGINLYEVFNFIDNFGIIFLSISYGLLICGLFIIILEYIKYLKYECGY